MRQQKKLHLFLFTGITLVLAGGAALFAFTQTASTSPEDGHGVTFWKHEIQKTSPEEAYGTLKKRYKEADSETGHEEAHNFGQALYEATGVDGITVCDSAFASGCFHQLVGDLLKDEGIGDLDAVRTACNDRMGCNHGVGHGLVGFLGYNHINLLESLDGCIAYGDSFYRGCVGGVFMEYNTRVLADDRGTPRPLQADAPFYPCEIIPEQFKYACYVWQTQLWEHTLFASSSGPEKIARVIELCTTISDATYRDGCLRGVGNNMWPIVNWDIPAMTDACRSTTSQQDFASCISGAAIFYYYETGDEATADTMCQVISNTQLQQTCQQLAGPRSAQSQS